MDRASIVLTTWGEVGDGGALTGGEGARAEEHSLTMRSG